MRRIPGPLCATTIAVTLSASLSQAVGGRSLAWLRPAVRRSRIIDRSNSANAPSIKTHRASRRGPTVEPRRCRNRSSPLAWSSRRKSSRSIRGAAQVIGQPCRDYVHLARDGLQQAIGLGRLDLDTSSRPILTIFAKMRIMHCNKFGNPMRRARLSCRARYAAFEIDRPPVCPSDGKEASPSASARSICRR